MKRGSTVLTTKQITWAYSKWNDGYTWAEISKVLHVAERTIKSNVDLYFGERNYMRKRKPLRYEEDEAEKEFHFTRDELRHLIDKVVLDVRSNEFYGTDDYITRRDKWSAY